MTAVFPAGSDLDRAEQHTLVDADDRELGPDTTALHPLAERVRAVFDAADIADHIDQNWITPQPRDDYDCLAY
ncbi:hypothetical protein ACWDUL_08370 [Nocardia niigatensis]|uniref:hypothetical protein n=1 Tax=Nocardia niigatensis TaxID=209249 RepID=UPI000311B2C2|nr:hypothetical protein [Nocardia niigatensis]